MRRRRTHFDRIALFADQPFLHLFDHNSTTESSTVKSSDFLGHILALASAMFLPAAASGATHLVIGVSDGDTIKLLSPGNQQVKCRMNSIDAPEAHQPWGDRSKQSLSDLVYRKHVDVTVTGTDRYGRSLCNVLIGGLDVNKEQVRRGMAWWYRKYSSDPAYAAAERVARNARVGLWSDPEPVPPWDFRREARLR